MCQLSVCQFMAEIGVPQITAASGSCREANSSNTRQCSKRKKQAKREEEREGQTEREERARARRTRAGRGQETEKERR